MHGALNALNSVAAEDRGEFDEFHAETQVGLVGTEALLRVDPRHGLDRRNVFARDGFDRSGDSHRGRVEDVLLRCEAHLEVELHELELAVGAEVFVAQAARDLEVPVAAADHAQLLEQLRALRQHVERAGLQP